eukprot:Hpha_TRINITY_DN20545_c0_g1::TRINITY_DN20545_c0_g1_i1::g.30652::m.30652
MSRNPSSRPPSRAPSRAGSRGPSRAASRVGSSKGGSPTQDLFGSSKDLLTSDDWSENYQGFRGAAERAREIIEHVDETTAAAEQLVDLERWQKQRDEVAESQIRTMSVLPPPNTTPAEPEEEGNFLENGVCEIEELAEQYAAAAIKGGITDLKFVAPSVQYEDGMCVETAGSKSAALAWESSLQGLGLKLKEEEPEEIDVTGRTAAVRMRASSLADPKAEGIVVTDTLLFDHDRCIV